MWSFCAVRVTASPRSKATLAHLLLACAAWLGVPTGTPAYAQLCDPSDSLPANVRGYRVVQTYPHDPQAFTQGLEVHGSTVYESTGLYGESTLRRVELETGAVLKTHRLPEHLFGEGITVPDERIIQLTWKSRRGFVYDKSSFALLHTFEYPTQGWGIAHNGRELIMSDGSAQLRFLDSRSMARRRTLTVCASGRPVPGLNELEWVNGRIFANVYGSPRVAIIDPVSGRVDSWIDLSELVSEHREAGVLNGIAYDPKARRLFVTGKKWPRLYELSVDE